MVMPKACHNCRNRRLRCDRSIPECHKCMSAGQECLGYGKLYKWVEKATPQDRNGAKSFVSSAVKTQEPLDSWSGPRLGSKIYAESADSNQLFKDVEPWSQVPSFSLLDPLLQDLELSSRHYLNYYAVRFCQDLVIYDSPERGTNPFRELVPMSQGYPFLREIIVAASALHFCNAMRWHRSPRPAVDALVDALRARHRAIKSLQAVIEHQKDLGDVELNDTEKDALLAAVLFFVNFALIDSGKGGWRAHMNFVGRLLSLRTPSSSQSNIQGTMTTGSQPDSKSSLDFVPFEPLIYLSFTPHSTSSAQSLGVRDYITSDSMAYYIWSNALDSLVSSGSRLVTNPLAFDGQHPDILPILLRTEANSYHSCPSRLLYAIFRTSQLARDVRSNGAGLLNHDQMRSCVELLEEVEAFDCDTWAAEVCAKIAADAGFLDEAELDYRRHIAATYRAAVCLYILLVAPESRSQVARCASYNEIGEDRVRAPANTAELAATIFYHLSFIPTNSPLFKFATWPIFLTGVETADFSRRAWVLERLRDMRDLCPWGMLTSTMETLVEIWRMRDSAPVVAEFEMDGSCQTGKSTAPSQERGCNNNWLMKLQGFKIDCLIV
ncbi:fungal-specific transcription factor domain-containing protein [Hypoxylon sp. FL1857]|nr:fungal-specific transcription factor domain-containing protein [Hypoxylon sp. FL1857]